MDSSKVKAFKPKSASPSKKSSPSKKAEETVETPQGKKNDVKKILLHTLNIIPHVLFVIVNIVKKNKFAVLPTVAFIKNFIDSNYKDLENTADNKPLLEKSKKFVKKFAEVFLIAYSKTALIDKGLILLSFIDIVSNEIPNILTQANKTKYVDPTTIFTGILTNAKEIDKEYNK